VTQTGLHVTQLLGFWDMSHLYHHLHASLLSDTTPGRQGKGWCNLGLIFAVHYSRSVGNGLDKAWRGEDDMERLDLDRRHRSACLVRFECCMNRRHGLELGFGGEENRCPGQLPPATMLTI
jgi:hypothetical protein